MKSSLLAILVLILIGCSGTRNVTHENPDELNETLLTYQDLIEVSYLNEHLSVIAHDSLEGRGTGTEGLEKAADYLISEYERLGLDPKGIEGSYRQPFTLVGTQQDSLVFSTYINESGEIIDRSVSSSESGGKFIKQMGGTRPIDAEVIFAGFGVEDAARNINQIEGEAVKDKWVLVFDDIPHVEDGDTLVDEEYDDRNRMMALFSNKDAAGVLVIPDADEEDFQEAAELSKDEFDVPGDLGLPYRKNNTMSGFPKGYNTIHPELAMNLLELDDLDQLDELKEEIKEDMAGFTAKPTGYSLGYQPHSSNITIETDNIVAMLKGSDPELRNEAIVLTSHYDHVGVGEPDSTGDDIYNGADDDGSGTVALLNVARAFAKAKEEGFTPRRSIIFLHVSAEENGLLGSRFYSDHPTFPVDRIAANINIDMIGRIDEEHEEQGVDEYAYIIGGDIISSQLDSLLVSANERASNIEYDNKYNDLEDANQFYRRSDHWNFGRLGIPFAFFFTGVHEDYHRPSDEVEKIEFEKLEAIIRTIYASTVLIANEDEAPEVDRQDFIDITRAQSR